MKNRKQRNVYIAWIMALCLLGGSLKSVPAAAAEFYGSESKQVLDLSVSTVEPGVRTAGLSRDESTAGKVDAMIGSCHFAVFDYSTPAGQDLRLETWTDSSGTVRKITVINFGSSGLWVGGIPLSLRKHQRFTD